MKITPITRKTTATALTDPDPSFVSMCKGVSPANQEPFRAVRSEDPEAPEEAAPMKMSKAKASSSVAALAQKGYGVMQFQFDKTVFKTADDVTKWLDDGGYSDYEVVERAKMFEVNDEDGGYEVGSVEPVPDAADGVKAFVGRLTGEEQIVEGDDADDGDDASAKKTDDRSDIQPRQRGKKKPMDDEEEVEKGAGCNHKKPKGKDDSEGDDADGADGEDEEGEEGSDADDADGEDGDVDADAADAAIPDEEGDDTAQKHGGKKKPMDDDEKKKSKGKAKAKPAADEEDDDEEEVKKGGDMKKKPTETSIALTDEQGEELRSKFADALDGMPVTSRKHIHPYIISDIAGALSTLKYIILDADYTGLDDQTVADLKTAALAGADAMVSVATQLKGEIGEFLASKVAEVTDEASAQKTSKTKTEGDEPAASDEPSSDDALEKRFKDMEAKFEDRVKAAEDKANAAETKAKAAEDALAERVAEDESRSQSRKAADGLDTEEDAPVKRSRASQTMLSAFGSRKANAK